jgi:hypothetical protein
MWIGGRLEGAQKKPRNDKDAGLVFPEENRHAQTRRRHSPLGDARHSPN